MNNNKIIYRVHALQRMFERKISLKLIRNILNTGKVVEDYSNEMPDPSFLILGYQGKKPVHVVVSENRSTNEVTIITAYIPDPQIWEKDNGNRK